MNFAGDGQRAFGEDELAWLREFAAMAAQGDKDLFGRYRLLDTLMVRLKALEATIDEEVEAASPLSQHEEIPPELRDQWEEESKAAVMAEYRHRRAGFLTALQGWLRDVWLHARAEGGRRARARRLLVARGGVWERAALPRGDPKYDGGRARERADTEAPSGTHRGVPRGDEVARP